VGEAVDLDAFEPLEVEEDLVGDFLKAHGHFEFVLRRGDKRVCIVEAKKRLSIHETSRLF
jgi:hypothetical protein